MKLSPGTTPPVCRVHDRPLICPACVGARGGTIGGKASSPKKRRAARRNAKRPRSREARDTLA